MDIGGILFALTFLFIVIAIIAATTWYKYKTWKYDRDLKDAHDKREQAHRHEVEIRTLLHDRGPQAVYRSPDAYPPMEGEALRYETGYQGQPPQTLQQQQQYPYGEPKG